MNFLSRNRVIYLLLMTLLASSCANRQVFRMEMLSPGFVNMPSAKKHVVILDHTGIQPVDVGHERRKSYRLVGDTSFNTEPLSGFLVRSLEDYLRKEGHYQSFTIYRRGEGVPAKTDEDAFQRSARISREDLSTISKDPDLNVLFCMDRLLTRSSSNLFYDGEKFVATRDVRVNMVWRVYDLDVDTLVTQFQINDSLYWLKTGSNPSAALRLLPDWQSSLAEIGDVLAEHLNPIFGPNWTSCEREYFISGSIRMKMAADLVRKKKLEEAALLWTEEYKHAWFRSKYRAAINMLFYEEVMGRPELALDWFDKAEKAMAESPFGYAEYDELLLKQWKPLLNARVKEIEKLKNYF